MRISDWSSDVCSSDLFNKTMVQHRSLENILRRDPRIGQFPQGVKIDSRIQVVLQFKQHPGIYLLNVCSGFHVNIRAKGYLSRTDGFNWQEILAKVSVSM